jgi:hypothetical protein
VSATEAPVKGEKADKAEKKQRPETEFVALIRPRGQENWQLIPSRYTGKNQDDAKRQVARALAEIDEWRAHIEGDGLEIAVTSARSFKPVLVKVEPQPAKVVIR